MEVSQSLLGDPQLRFKAVPFCPITLIYHMVNKLFIKIIPFKELAEAYQYMEVNEQVGKIVGTLGK